MNVIATKYIQGPPGAPGMDGGTQPLGPGAVTADNLAAGIVSQLTDGVVAALGSAGLLLPPIKTEATTARTLAQNDQGAVVRFTSSGASTATIATHASQGIAVGQSIRCTRYSATGTLAIAWPSGVTVNGVAGPGSMAVVAAYKSIVVTQMASDEWLAEGAIA